jgi:amicyanin
MRPALIAAALAASCALAIPASSALASAQSATIANFQFEPTPITVMTGETVTWTNKDAVAHTVTSTGAKQFDSGNLQAGKSFSFTFDTPGTYQYTCTLHPYMKGEVIVQGMSMTMPKSAPRSGPMAPSKPVPSPPMTGVSVEVSPHPAHGERTISVSSPHPGARVLLQLYSREHFSWLQVAHTTLDAQGHATLRLKASVRRKLRVIVLGTGTSPTLTSRTLRTVPRAA